MEKDFIAGWLSDQIDDSFYEFPEDFDSENAVRQLKEWFDDSIIFDHLDHLLSLHLEKLKN